MLYPALPVSLPMPVLLEINVYDLEWNEKPINDQHNKTQLYETSTISRFFVTDNERLFQTSLSGTHW